MGSKLRALLMLFLIFMLNALPILYACGPVCGYSHPLKPPSNHHGEPELPNHHAPAIKHPPRRGGVSHSKPPLFFPPIITPPVTVPRPSLPYPPHTGGGGAPGGVPGAPGGIPGGGVPGAPGGIPGGGIPGAPGGIPGGGIPGAPGGIPGSPGGGAPGLPGGNPPPVGGVPGAPSPATTNATCPIDALRLGLCLDLLGVIQIGIGNPIQNVCCPVIQGLLELEAAVCLCTAIRLRLLNLQIFIPLALQVLITCGQNPPPGFTCPPLQ